jgi:polyhydroxyalkanoate synthesis regulator phasin
MDEGTDGKTSSRRRRRLVERLDRMVASGQVSEAEAQRLRAAATPSQFEDAERHIRVRHARSSLDAAVEAGRLTKGEAERYLERLRNGEHPRSLRAQLASLAPRSRRV